MPSQRLSFKGASGETLDARLELPETEPVAYALFAHCFTCSKDTVAASRLSRALADLGIAVLRFDFTGLGNSEGDFSNTNFSSNVDDLLHAVDHLRAHHMAPAILIGHSLGGAAVLSAAGSVPEATAVVTIGAPSDPAHVQHLFEDSVEEITARGEQEVTLGGRQFLIRKQFLDDINSQKLSEKTRTLKKALLVLHSPQDITVNIDHARHIFEAARHPKSFVSLDGADHLLTRRADAGYVAQIICAWVSRYLPEAVRTQPDEEPRTVIVTETGEGKFAQRVQVGPHSMPADEPRSFGGNDSGPSPYDFLLTSLGTCTSMTIRMYAERKKLPLQKVEVELSHEKIHATDCDHCETESGKIDKIDRVVRLTGDLDEDQRQRLLEIADKCPVHRTLHSEIVIETELGQ